MKLRRTQAAARAALGQYDAVMRDAGGRNQGPPTAKLYLGHDVTLAAAGRVSRWKVSQSISVLERLPSSAGAHLLVLSRQGSPPPRPPARESLGLWS